MVSTTVGMFGDDGIRAGVNQIKLIRVLNFHLFLFVWYNAPHHFLGGTNLFPEMLCLGHQPADEGEKSLCSKHVIRSQLSSVPFCVV